jgi:hypothetical protein
VLTVSLPTILSTGRRRCCLASSAWRCGRLGEAHLIGATIFTLEIKRIRHCEERSDEAIQGRLRRQTLGLRRKGAFDASRPWIASLRLQ